MCLPERMGFMQFEYRLNLLLYTTFRKLFFSCMLLLSVSEFFNVPCYFYFFYTKFQNGHLGILCNSFDRGAIGPYRKLAAVAVTPDDFPEGCEGLTLQSLLHRRSSTVYALINVLRYLHNFIYFSFQHKVVANIHAFFFSFF